MLLDTYAWVEHFKGSEKGKQVDKLIIDEECYTSILSIAEIAEWCLKNNIDLTYCIDIAKKLSMIIDLDLNIVVLAAKLNFEYKKSIKNWGMLDSLIYATARIYGKKILTGDKHFENLEDVIIL